MMKMTGNPTNPILAAPAQGDLRLRLPVNAELFATTGLHQLFERVDLDADKPVERSWLYVPAQQLQRAREQLSLDLRRESREPWLATPLDADEGYLHPVIGAEGLLGLLAQNSASLPEVAPDELQSWTNLLTDRILKHRADESRITFDFAQELFQRDESVEQFLKRFLSLAVSYWPRSAAGIYVEAQGIYQLRLVVGDVMRCHELASQLSQDTTFKFLEALCQHENLVPADPQHTAATFLNLPPDFFFVHQGMHSERANQLLVVIGPGEAPAGSTRNIRLLSGLLSRLNEAQFATPHDLISLYSRVSSQGLGAASLDTTVRELFELLARQINVSRLTVLRTDSAGVPAASWIASGYSSVQVKTQEGGSFSFPPEARKSLSRGEMYHLGDITAGELSDSEAKQRYLENVHSECYIPVKCRKQAAGAIIVGSPVTGDYLTRFSGLFEAIAGYVATSITLESFADQRVIPAGGHPVSDRSASRLATLRKLVDGFLHGMSSRVSVVIGQTELLGAVDSPVRPPENGKSGLEKISLAGNELADRIVSLRTIIDLVEAGADAGIAGAQFLKDLPSMLEGVARKTKDTRNVDIAINFTASVRQSYRIMMADAVDVIIPMVMAVMEQAICSGTLAIQGSSKGNRPTVSVQFRKNVLGYTTVENMLLKAFPEIVRVPEAKSEETFSVHGCTVGWRLLNDDTYQLTLICSPATEMPGKADHSAEGRRS